MPPNKFSIIIPTFNSAKFINLALNSIIENNYKDCEVVVIDDCSGDETVELVKLINKNSDIDIRIFINEANKGAAYSRNIGIRKSRYDWIVFLDSDDYFTHDKLSTLNKYINNNKRAKIICNSQWWVGKNYRIRVENYKTYNKKLHPFVSLFRRNSISTSALTIEKKTIESEGGFDASIVSGQDYELWLRLAKKEPIFFIKKILTFHSIREGSLGSNPERRFVCMLKIYKIHEKDLSKFSNAAFIERRMFLSKVYLQYSYGLFSQGLYKKAIVSLLRGMAYWPFRVDLLVRLVKYGFKTT
jgi:teichuronic acid biosynthesis glycosyltransferase TuaG